MNGLSLPAACLCLWTGAALGCLFLLLKLLRLLLRGGRLMTAVMDAAFCLFCAAVAFLCALAVDKGRLRLAQVVLQGLGAWGAIAALDPFVVGLARLVRKIVRRLAAAAGRPVRWMVGKATKIFHKFRPKPRKVKKPGPRRKKRKKPLEKLT